MFRKSGPHFSSPFLNLEIPCHACDSCKLSTVQECASLTKIYTAMETIGLVDQNKTIEQMCSYIGDSLDNISDCNTFPGMLSQCYHNPEIIPKFKGVIEAFKMANETKLFLERIGKLGEWPQLMDEWMIPYEKYVDHYAPEICHNICYWANPIIPRPPNPFPIFP